MAFLARHSFPSAIKTRSGAVRQIRSRTLAAPRRALNSDANNEIEEKRRALSMIYESSVPLTGAELKAILKNRQVRISFRGPEVRMQVLPQTWSVPDELWENLALVLNEWQAASIMRDIVSIKLDIADATEAVNVPLKVQRTLQRDYNDWIDHA